MRDSSKAVIAVVVGVIVTVSLAFVLMPYWLPPLQQIPDRTMNPEPTTEPEVIEPTREPESTPEPDTLDEPQSSANVTIQYTWIWGKSLVGTYGTVEADPGKVFLSVHMTIKNNGYDSFSTDPSYFYVIVNGISDSVKCSYESRTYTSENWNNTIISNGETFKGRLHFQVPDSWLFLEFEYKATSGNFNVVWYE